MKLRWLVFSTAFGLSAAHSLATQPTPQQLTHWVERNLGSNRGLLDECGLRRGTFISWQVEDRASMTDQELGALRAIVAGKPEHPDAWIVAAEEKRRSSGPDRANYSAFLNRSDEWRFNTTIGAEFIGDLVYSPRQSWYLGEETLKLFDPAAVASGKDNDQLPQAELNVFRPIVARFVLGGLPLWEADEYLAMEPIITGDRWSVKLRRAETATVKLEARFAGRWLQEEGRGLVESMTYVRNDYKPDTVGERVEFDGWTKDESIGVWRAASVTHRRPSGKISRVISWTNGGVDETRVAALMRPPTLDAKDPLRRKPVSKVIDYSTGSVEQRTPAGVSTSRLEGAGTRFQTDTPWARYAGWGGAIFLVVGLVYWRSRASRA